MPAGRPIGALARAAPKVCGAHAWRGLGPWRNAGARGGAGSGIWEQTCCIGRFRVHASEVVSQDRNGCGRPVLARQGSGKDKVHTRATASQNPITTSPAITAAVSSPAAAACAPWTLRYMHRPPYSMAACAARLTITQTGRRTRAVHQRPEGVQGQERKDGLVETKISRV